MPPSSRFTNHREPRGFGRHHRTLLLIAILVGAAGVAKSRVTAQGGLPVVGGAWTFAGPAPITGGEVEGIANGPVSGAVQAIVAHPTNPDIVWIGSTNGGVWKTTNATSLNPQWTPLTDGAPSLQIASLSLDPTDPTHNTLVAGIGKTTRFLNFPGEGQAFLRTTNGGITWTAYSPPTLPNVSIRNVLARGATIIATTGDVYRSVDSGVTFTQIPGSSGLQGIFFSDLVGDPSNPQVLYAISRSGIFKSVDTGATWTKVSTSIVDNAIKGSIVVTDARLAVGSAGQVFAGIVDNGQLRALFRSAPGGTPWTQLDTPTTNENGSVFPLQLTITVDTDSRNNFSIAADPTDPNIVYVGGGRQPLAGDGLASTPNSLGAAQKTGRLFRVDASLPPGTQVSSLTHCAAPTTACGNAVSTASNSAPHSYSRRMVVDANGHILEGDDGGLYRRTNPRGVGDWVSVVGDLANTEMYSVAWDRVSDAIVSGNQDTGVSEQASAGATVWRQVQPGSGGEVAVDDLSSPTQSVRYSSEQHLTRFMRRVVDVNGNVTSTIFPALTIVSGQAPLVSQQPVTPLQVNTVAPQRLVIATQGSGMVPRTYESLDRGETLREVPRTPNNQAISFPTAVLAGGRSGGADNPDIIYLSFASQTLVRTLPSGSLDPTFDSPGGSVADIAVDPADWQKAYAAIGRVVGGAQVFATVDAGFDWYEITGNLAGARPLRSAVLVPGSPGALIVGGDDGVFRMALDTPGTWQRLGMGLPNVSVWDLDYDSADDVLVAAMVGRGAWTLRSVGNLGAVPPPPTNVSATSVSPGGVSVAWTASTGATSYRVYRSTDSVSYALVGTTTETTFSDTTVAPGAAYVYKVRAFGAAESVDSARDVTTTAVFSDATVTPGATVVTAAHVTELLQAVNAVRTLAGLPPMSFTAPAPAVAQTIRAQHLIDLRDGIAAARAALGLSAPSFIDPSITAGVTPIRAAHVTELRDAVR
jgi:hypothetical protein